MENKNIVMFDNDPKEYKEYLEGIREGTGLEWEPKCFKANNPQTSKFIKLIIYIKYFIFPLKIFLVRKKYNIIIGWQAFYAISFAFFCRLFHVKKQNFVVVQHCIYKAKKGLIGKIYKSFMRFSLNNKYVDIIQTEAEGYIKVLNEELGIDLKKIHYIQFGVNDFTKWEESDIDIPYKNYILCIGRSNRDWEFVIDALSNTKFQVIVICDALKINSDCKNIKILNNIDTISSLPYIKNCYCMITAVKDGSLSSGDTVFCQQLCFGKPGIIVKPCSLTKNYLKEGYNGVSVERNKEALVSAIEKIYSDIGYYNYLSKNCRNDFIEKYTLKTHSKKIGALIVEIMEKN